MEKILSVKADNDRAKQQVKQFQKHSLVQVKDKIYNFLYIAYVAC